MDELREGVRILEACTWVEAGRPKKFPIALDAAVDPPCPHLEAFSPAADFHSGHQGIPSFASVRKYSHAPEGHVWPEKSRGFPRA